LSVLDLGKDFIYLGYNMLDSKDLEALVQAKFENLTELYLSHI
jgi:hypothetical protein